MNETSNETVALENMTSQEKTEWRLTGVEPVREVVEEKPAKAEVIEIKSKPEPEKVEEVTTDVAEDAASGTAIKTEEQKGGAKKPTQMGYKDLRSRIAELEAQIAKGAKPVAADSEAAKADAKTKEVERKRPRSNDQNTDGTPKYKTWDEYEDAADAYNREQVRMELQQEQSKAQLTTEKEKLEKESQQQVRGRADEARKKYSDFDAKVLDPTLKIPQGGVLATWVLDPGNEQGMEIAYYFGTHREELDKFNTLTPFQQARELTRLEDKLSQGTETPEKSDVEVKAAPTKVTKAPPPAKEVGGRGSASGNEEDGLVGSGDFRAYKRVVDKKEIATRK